MAHTREKGCGVFIIHQVNLLGCFWLWFDYHFNINKSSSGSRNSQNILSSWITHLDAFKSPISAPVPLSILNLYYNRDQLKTQSTCTCRMEHLQNTTSMGHLLLCWKAKWITENLINVPLGSVLLGPHHAYAHVCLCPHTQQPNHHRTHFLPDYPLVRPMQEHAWLKSSGHWFILKQRREQETRGEKWVKWLCQVHGLLTMWD